MFLIFLPGFRSPQDILTKIIFPTIFSHYMFILYDFNQVYIFHNVHEKELDQFFKNAPIHIVKHERDAPSYILFNLSFFLSL